MEATLTARPTEYKGVLFRSKSEAILARSFCLCGFPWEYEPEDIKSGDWHPDFSLCLKLVIKRAMRIGFAIAEYKPSRPTDCYMREAVVRFNDCIKDCDHIAAMIIYGSPFNDSERGVLELSGDRKEWRSCDNFAKHLCGKWPEAKGYRFDLLHGGAR